MFTRSLFFAVIAALVTAAPPVLADPLPLLREIRATGGGSTQRIELVIDRPVPFITYTMAQLRRAVIDLPQVEPGEVKEAIPVGSGLIDKITVQKKTVNDVPLTRVLIHFQQDAEVSIAADAADGRKIVALLRAAKPAPVAVAAPAKPSLPSQPPPRPAPAPAAVTPAPLSRPGDGRKPSIGKISVTATGLEVTADAPLADFRTFTLKEPHRLVIDLPRAKGSPAKITLPANAWEILSARTGVYPDKVRIVFDRKSSPFPPYKVEATAGGLRITFASPTSQKSKYLQREPRALHE